MSYKRKPWELATAIVPGVTIAHSGSKLLHYGVHCARQSPYWSFYLVSPWCHLLSQRYSFDTGLTPWLNPLLYLLIRELVIKIRALSEILSFLSITAVTWQFYVYSRLQQEVPNASQSDQVWQSLATCFARL